MTTNLYHELPLVFFPDQAEPFATRRYGFTRIEGPFPHPILAAVVMICAYRIARWLEWSEGWPDQMPLCSVSKVRFCELALVAGALMTISRGPWLGAIAGGLAVSVFRAPTGRAMITRALLIACIGLPVTGLLRSYTSVERSTAETATQETAAYRTELLRSYIAVAKQRPQWGWGVTDKPGGQAFPIIDGQTSIDNHYLLIALEHGEYALALMAFILFWTPTRLFLFQASRPGSGIAKLLALTLGSLYIVFIVSLATAWLGGQTQAILFLIAGWSEGLLAKPAIDKVPELESVLPSRFAFARVMV